MKWPHVQLGALCQLYNGRAFQPSDWSTTGLPIIRIQNLNNRHNPFNYWDGSLDRQVKVNPGDVLLAWSGTPGTSFGAHIWRGSVGVLNQHIFRVDLDENLISREWAVRVINFHLNRLIQQAHGGVGLRHVTRGMVEELEIPLPATKEQQRIVGLLGQADGLRRQRTEASLLTDRILPALFHKMFGDPATNPRGWPRKKLGELLDRIDSGWSPVCETRQAAPGEWGVLKLGAVTTNRYLETENKALPAALDVQPELEVFSGDLLFTRKNTRELVGACAYVESTRPKLMLSDLIFRLRLKPSADIHPLYLWALLIYPSKRSSIQLLAGGSSGSMPNISKGRLETLGIEMPPYRMQAAFAEAATNCDSLRKRSKQARENIENLFSVLLHRAFSGELTAKWREAHLKELLAEMDHQKRLLGSVKSQIE
jgi:type I restriction enzyme, S subunit